MSWFQKYIRAHSFLGYDDSVNGWSDLSPKQKILMSFKMLQDLVGILFILVFTLIGIDWLVGLIL